ncbi:MAG: hypothetical protein WBG90_17785 [Saonia sp.]
METFNSRNTKDYLKELFHTRLFLENETNYSEVIKNLRVRGYKTVDSVIILLLTILPLAYYSFELIPEGLSELKIKWVTIGAHGFTDVHTFVWFINYKLSILIPLFIWFITSRHWWRYAVLVPIVLYTYQLWEGTQEELIQMGEIEYFRAFPIVICVIVLLLVLSHVVNYQSKVLDIYESLSKEIEENLERLEDVKGTMVDQKILFHEIKIQKHQNENLKTNLDALIQLREKLSSELGKVNKK